MILKQTHSW